jgi:3-hydroxyisobutyrate dehydrogenase-like beta-hydroxyacid dehydrogenase
MSDDLVVRVGFVGAGQMGGPMVERLLRAGVIVDMYARRDDAAERFRAMGARVSDSLGGVAAAANVIVVCLFDQPQVTEVVFGDHGLLASARPGSVLVNHTTVGVQLIRQVAETARGRGIDVVDAPVSGTATDILAGRLTVLAGGSDTAIERCRPVLSCYAGNIVATGEVGSASVIKIVNNAVFAANLRISVDAMRLVGELGVEPALAATALRHCSGASYALGIIEASGVAGVMGAERYLVKDVATVRAVAAELGADLGLLGEVAADGRIGSR